MPTPFQGGRTANYMVKGILTLLGLAAAAGGGYLISSQRTFNDDVPLNFGTDQDIVLKYDTGGIDTFSMTGDKFTAVFTSDYQFDATDFYWTTTSGDMYFDSVGLFSVQADTGISLKMETNAVADTDGADIEIQAQDGGTHSSNNPNGGNIVFQCSAQGSGGSGQKGAISFLDTAGAERFKITGSGGVQFAANVTPTTAGARDLGSTSLELRSAYFGDDSTCGVSVGLDQNGRFYYDEATNDEVTVSSTGHMAFRPAGSGEIRFYDSAGGALRFYMQAGGNLRVAADVIPTSNAARDLGSSTLTFAETWTRQVSADSGQNTTVTASGGGYVVLSSSKADTGDPTGAEGMFYINTFDNVLKVYADGAWRTIASW